MTSHWFISAVRLRSFKSFGAAWTDLHLGNPYVLGIVGPNGAGKSNLLEALMFASGADAADLRVSSLKELCNTDAKDQLCEVEFQIQQAAQASTLPNIPRKSTAATAPGNTFMIRAALTPDGSRVFQLDGRNKTAEQVKEFLRSRGVFLDTGVSVIRQAAVTKLADSNSPAAVAAIIATASGLVRWNDETRRAATELSAARSALQEIHVNLKHLRRLVQADTARWAEAEAAQKLQTQVRATALQLLSAYAGQRMNQEEMILTIQTNIASPKDNIDALDARMSELGSRIQKTVSDQEAAQQQVGNTRSQVLQLIRNVATLEQQAQDAAQHLQLGQSVHERRQALRSEVADLNQQMSAALAALQVAGEKLEDAEAAASEAKEAGENMQDPAAYVSELQRMLAAAARTADSWKQRQADHESQLHQAKADVQRMKQDLSKLEQEHLQRVSQHEPNKHLLQTFQQSKLHKERSIQQLQESLSMTTVRARVLQSQLGISKPIQPQNKGRQLPSRLHHLFDFNMPSQPQDMPQNHQPTYSSDDPLSSPAADNAKQWLLALSVIAGSSLDVIVTADGSQINALLADPAEVTDACGPPACTAHGRSGDEKIRFWPLDRLTCSDRTQVQRQAQNAFGPGKVVVPLDLLTYPQQLHTAMVRAFGGYVLAADSSVAAQLADTWNIASVTPDGTVSRKGSISGGHRGAGGGAAGRPVMRPQAILLNKLELQIVKESQLQLTKQISTLQAELHGMERRYMEACDLGEQVDMMAMECATLQRNLTSASQRVANLTARIAACRQQLTAAEQEATRYKDLHEAAQQQLQHSHTPGNTKQAAAALLSMRQQEVQQAARQAKAAQTEHDTIHAALTTAQAELRKLDRQWDSLVCDVEVNSAFDQVDLNSASCQVADDDGKGVHNEDGGALSDSDPDDGEHDSIDQRDAVQLQALVRWHKQLESKLSKANQKLQEAKQKVDEAARLDADLGHQLNQLRSDSKTVLKAVSNQQSSLEQQEANLESARRQLSQLASRCNDLMKEFGIPPSALTANKQHSTTTAPASERGAAAGGGGEGGTATANGDVISLSDQLSTLKAQYEALGDVKALTSTEHLARQARVSDMQLFDQRAGMLASGADALESGIKESHHQVMSAHNAVLTSIRIRFQELCRYLLPSMRFTLATPTGNANSPPDPSLPAHVSSSSATKKRVRHDQDTAAGRGPVIMFKRISAQDRLRSADPGTDDEDLDDLDRLQELGEASAANAKPQGWFSSLEQLSGGQRTMVSLALLLAATCEGCRSSVLLLDEVDAALDESNQASVAQLLSLLSHGALTRMNTSRGPTSQAHKAAPGNAIIHPPVVPAAPAQGPGVQVICVSHQPAFQKACDALVQISRGETGTKQQQQQQQQVVNRPMLGGDQAGASTAPADVDAAVSGKQGNAVVGPAQRQASGAGVQVSKAVKVVSAGRGRGRKRRTK